MSKLRKYHRNLEDIEKIILRAKAEKFRADGMSYRKISKKLNISEGKLTKLIGKSNYFFNEDIKRKARNLCKRSSLSFITIGEKVGALAVSVKRWCKGLKRPKGARIRRQYSEKIIKEAKNLCRHSTLTFVKIGKKIGAPKLQVLRWCKGLKRPKGARIHKQYGKETKKEVQDLCRRSTLTFVKIGKKTGAPVASVKRWCKELKRPKGIRKHAYSENLCDITLTDVEIGKKVRKWCKKTKRPKKDKK